MTRIPYSLSRCNSVVTVVVVVLAVVTVVVMVVPVVGGGYCSGGRMGISRIVIRY